MHYWSRLQPVLIPKTPWQVSSPRMYYFTSRFKIKQAEANSLLASATPVGRKQNPDTRLSYVLACSWTGRSRAKQPVWGVLFCWCQLHSWVYFHRRPFCAVTEPCRKVQSSTCHGEPRLGRRGMAAGGDVCFVLASSAILGADICSWFFLCACTNQTGHLHRNTLPKCPDAGLSLDLSIIECQKLLNLPISFMPVEATGTQCPMNSGQLMEPWEQVW